jgi:hypothetical protein
MRLAIAMLAGMLVVGGAAFAGELSAEQRGLIEGFAAYRRVAIGYLRTQNADLGAVEIERLRDQLIADRGKIGAVALTDMAFSIALAWTEAQVAGALKAADDGDIERARALLEQAAKPFDGWREANGIRLFSDCIAEISAAYGPLDTYRLSAPDLGDAALGARIAAATGQVVATLDRCDREAAPVMRTEPVFRRLFDGMRSSLRQIPDAVTARDGALLHRLLIEQRSYDELLSFRFG